MTKIYKGFTSNLVFPPIYQTTRLGFDSTESVLDPLEKRMAFLEGGESALLLSSGIAAYSVAIMALAQAGDHIITHADINRDTFHYFNDVLPKLGIEKSFVEVTNLESIEASIQDSTKVIFLETPSNISIKISNIKKISELAHQHGIKVIVDNTLSTPLNQNPLDLGADVVVYFCTKYMNGHNDVRAGVIIGESKFITNCKDLIKDFGGKLKELDAWLLQRSMKTLGLRMKCHNSNAQLVADFLEQHPVVEKVHYPGLKSHPQHEVAKRQMHGFGANLNIELKGGQETINQFINRNQILNRTVSLGSVESLISQVVTPVHYDVPIEFRKLYGITEKLIRISVGIEEIEDILDDLECSLDI